MTKTKSTTIYVNNEVLAYLQELEITNGFRTVSSNSAKLEALITHYERTKNL